MKYHFALNTDIDQRNLSLFKYWHSTITVKYTTFLTNPFLQTNTTYATRVMPDPGSNVLMFEHFRGDI